jgi:peptidoglycan/LPS O-acetylase OafA/YrhL
MDSKRYQYIDILRGIAIIGVLLIHASFFGTGSSGFNNDFMSIIREGQRGVQLFFIVSAFTILSTYIKHSQTEIHTKQNFFIRRFFRIVPLYLLAFLLYFSLRFIGNGDPFDFTSTNTIIGIALTLFFLNGFHPYWINNIIPGGWSVATEVLFYTTIPFIVKYIKSLKTATYFFVISVLLKGVLFLILQYLFVKVLNYSELGVQTFTYLYLPGQLPIFALGFCLYYFLNEKSENKYYYLAIMTAPIILIQILGIQSLIDIFDTRLLLWGFVFLGLSIYMQKNSKDCIFSRFVAYIGKISYSLYLLHWAVLFFLDKFKLLDFIPQNTPFLTHLNYGLRFTIALGISMVLASLSYKFIEQPFINWGKRIIDKREKKEA